MAILPVRVVTLLWPIQDAGGPPPSVRPFGDHGYGPDGRLMEGIALRISFAEPVFVVERE